MRNKKKKMTIGKLAESANVGVETVRFYLRKGLLVKPPKGMGYTKYSSDDLKKLQFIRRSKNLGFTLNEVKELIEYEHCHVSSESINKLVVKKISEIRKKINDLNMMLIALEEFLKSCGENPKCSENCCKIYDCFERDWDCCK